MPGAALHEGAGWFAGSQDASRFPEGLLRDVSGQKSALQGNAALGRCSLAGHCGLAVPLVGLPLSSRVVTFVPPGCALGELRLLPFICCLLSII